MSQLTDSGHYKRFAFPCFYNYPLILRAEAESLGGGDVGKGEIEPCPGLSLYRGVCEIRGVGG